MARLDKELSEALTARRWSEAQARVVVEVWRASGESMAKFAEGHGIGAERLRRWARWFEASEAVGGASREASVAGDGCESSFREVRPKWSARAAIRSSIPPLVMSCGGDLRIEVPVGFDPATLLAILDVLESEAERW